MGDGAGSRATVKTRRPFSLAVTVAAPFTAGVTTADEEHPAVSRYPAACTQGEMDAGHRPDRQLNPEKSDSVPARQTFTLEIASER
ncbi:hypothetical protein D3C85_1603850 [compost metagenome]